MRRAWRCKGLTAVLALAVFWVLWGAPRACADDAGKGWEYCYTNFPGATGYISGQATYFTTVFAFENGSAYGNPFSAYVEKKYSLRSAGPAGCSYGGIQSGIESSLHQRVAELKAAGHAVVETDWTKDKHEALMAELAKNPPPPPAATPAAKKNPPPPPAATPAARKNPPPSAAQSAYEKALEAQRPQSNAGPASNAGAGASSAAAAAEKFTYCVTMGSRRGNGSARESYYFTGMFPVSPTLHPQRAFLLMLQAAHPQEDIGSVACMTAQPLERMQTAMAHDVAGKRAKYNVIETNWRPKP